jgi:hypothetical protein
MLETVHDWPMYIYPHLVSQELDYTSAGSAHTFEQMRVNVDKEMESDKYASVGYFAAWDPLNPDDKHGLPASPCTHAAFVWELRDEIAEDAEASDPICIIFEPQEGIRPGSGFKHNKLPKLWQQIGQHIGSSNVHVVRGSQEVTAGNCLRVCMDFLAFAYSGEMTRPLTAELFRTEDRTKLKDTVILRTLLNEHWRPFHEIEPILEEEEDQLMKSASRGRVSTKFFLPKCPCPVEINDVETIVID